MPNRRWASFFTGLVSCKYQQYIEASLCPKMKSHWIKKIAMLGVLFYLAINVNGAD